MILPTVTQSFGTFVSILVIWQKGAFVEGWKYLKKQFFCVYSFDKVARHIVVFKQYENATFYLSLYLPFLYISISLSPSLFLPLSLYILLFLSFPPSLFPSFSLSLFLSSFPFFFFCYTITLNMFVIPFLVFSSLLDSFWL